MIYWELILGFLKVGLFSFGGAYGAIPLIREVVLSYGWIGDEELAYFIAVAESTPGPVMVNLATYIGSIKAGVLGSALATLMTILPAFLIILILAVVLKNSLDNPWVKAVIRGINPCVIGIILAIGLYMLLGNVGVVGEAAFNWRNLALTLGLAALSGWHLIKKKKPFPPIRLIGIAAIAGMILFAY